MNPIIFLLLCFHTPIVMAQAIYKSVDEQGQVIYSDQPPDKPKAKTEVVELPADSSESQKAAARQRAEQIITEAERLEAERQQTRKESSSSPPEPPQISAEDQARLTELKQRLDVIARGHQGSKSSKRRRLHATYQQITDIYQKYGLTPEFAPPTQP